jgi:hypothetical protein
MNAIDAMADLSITPEKLVSLLKAAPKAGASFPSLSDFAAWDL